MKKIFYGMVALLLATTMSINAGERGKFIHVDNSVNKNLKPQIAFCQDRKNGVDITTLLVQTVNTNSYFEFTDASRILLRFTNSDKTIRLNRVASSNVKTRKYTKKNGTATITFYETVTEYEVTPEVLQALTDGEAIVKVRVVFKENDAKDYEIAEGYQAKMATDLLKSFEEAKEKNAKSNGDMSDEDF